MLVPGAATSGGDDLAVILETLSEPRLHCQSGPMGREQLAELRFLPTGTELSEMPAVAFFCSVTLTRAISDGGRTAIMDHVEDARRRGGEYAAALEQQLLQGGQQ